MSDAPVRSKSRGRRLRRLFGSACVVALVAAASAVVMPGSAQAAITSNQTGWHDNHYYTLWTDSPGTVAMDLGPGGNYRVAWNGTYEFFAGKGWNPGGRGIVAYWGSFNPSGNAYLALHGWTKNPLVEYKIVESWGSWRPPGGPGFRGTLVTDGGVYDIYMTQRTGCPASTRIASTGASGRQSGWAAPSPWEITSTRGPASGWTSAPTTTRSWPHGATRAAVPRTSRSAVHIERAAGDLCGPVRQNASTRAWRGWCPSSSGHDPGRVR
ncbi:hypothetical protein Phou_050780 [Phytohabitans houttuyneae]|uniref:Endo-1,4-beta-xylanase n=1 Tax=Phytohabitans houttuyneae TaxID=1076126 RepID=A0A6V8KEX0_9ACTN|nr:hypothetical protein Phou_050780 [Phytohabitans houttuyneae]